MAQNYTLTCNISGDSATNYEWEKGDMELEDAGATLSFYPIKLNDSGLYTCRIIGNYSQSISKELTLRSMETHTVIPKLTI